MSFQSGQFLICCSILFHKISFLNRTKSVTVNPGKRFTIMEVPNVSVCFYPMVVSSFLNLQHTIPCASSEDFLIVEIFF